MRTVSKRLSLAALLWLAVSLILAGVPVAHAADKPPDAGAAPADPDPWRIGFTAYGWLTNISGSAGARGQSVAIDASFIDIVQKSDSLGAFMGYFEADKGRVGLYTDFMWMKTGFGQAVSAYRNPLPGLALTVNGNAGLTTELAMVEVGGLYELQRWSGTERSFTAVDAVLGFRYWNSTNSLTLDATGTASYAPLGISASRRVGISLSTTMQWVDPVIGLRLRHEFSPTQGILVRGDVGGFGLGNQFSWQALGVYTHKWKRDGYDLAAVVGYRAMGTRYSSGTGFDANSLDLVIHGPVIGFGIRF